MDADWVSVVFVGGGALDGTPFALPGSQTRYEVPVDEDGVIVHYIYERADIIDPAEALHDADGRTRFVFVGQQKSP